MRRSRAHATTTRACAKKRPQERGLPGLGVLGLAKLYAVEIAGTVTFVVFVVAEAARIIHHLIR
jgi:hypothetical protein